MRTSLLILTLALTACATPQERAARYQADMERDMTIYGPACSRLGYQVNSDAWRNCVLQLSAKEAWQRAPYSGYYAGYGPGHWRGGGMWGPYW